MSLAEFCDLSWAHLARPPGGFSDPYEFRELMKAMVGYGDETVEQVQARHKSKSSKPSSKASTPEATPAAKPKKSELDKLAALMANAKPRLAPPVS